MAMTPCRADGCGKAFGLWSIKGLCAGLHSQTETPYYRHMQKYSTSSTPIEGTPDDPQAKQRSIAAHARVVSAHGGNLKSVFQSGLRTCIECPDLPPGSMGATLAAAAAALPIAPPTPAATTERSAPTAPTPTPAPPPIQRAPPPPPRIPGLARAAADLAAAKPAADYDIMALVDFNLDLIRDARLLTQHFESRGKDDDMRAQALIQPIIYAWRAMSATLSAEEQIEASNLVPGLPLRHAPVAAGRRGVAALKMHYLAYIAICARPLGARPRRYADMLAIATTIAASPQALLDTIHGLLADADAASPLNTLDNEEDEFGASRQRRPIRGEDRRQGRLPRPCGGARKGVASTLTGSSGRYLQAGGSSRVR